MAVGYRYDLKPQDNGWWLVRFPEVREALTEGETEGTAREAALDCVIAALEGYVKAGRTIPRPVPAQPGDPRATLPSLMTAKLAVHETMRSKGWSRPALADRLGASDVALRRLLDLRHHSDIRAIDRALTAMNAELAIELPDADTGKRAA